MGVVKGGYTDTSFWERNPDLLAMCAFKRLYDEDPTKEKAQSSQWMWAVYMAYDYQSAYFDMLPEDRKYQVANGYLMYPNFFKDLEREHPEVITTYNELQKTAPRRAVEACNLMLQQRLQYMETLEYKADTAKAIDDMNLTTPKLLVALEALKESVRKQEQSEVRGGQELTLLAEKKIEALPVPIDEPKLSTHGGRNLGQLTEAVAELQSDDLGEDHAESL